MWVTRKSFEYLTCSERVFLLRLSDTRRSIPLSRRGIHTLMRLNCCSSCAPTRYSPAWIVNSGFIDLAPTRPSNAPLQLRALREKKASRQLQAVVRRFFEKL